MTLRYNLDMQEYLDMDGVQSSRLKHMLHSPKDYIQSVHKPYVETPAQQLGTAIHCAILEPSEFEKRYALTTEEKRPRNKGEGHKYWKEFKSANEGKICLGYEDSFKVLSVMEAAHNHRGLKQILSSGHPEVTGFYDYNDLISLKARTDWLGGDGILWDVKSTSDKMDDYSLFRTVRKYNYGFQAAHHMRVISNYAKVNGFGWIFVSTAYPGVHIVTRRAMDVTISTGYRDHQFALDLLNECLQSGEWPGLEDDINYLMEN